MAVELAQAKGSIQKAAPELGVDAGRISRWKQRYRKTDPTLAYSPPLTQEQQEIRRLQRELREA